MKNNMTKKEAIQRSASWWFCENILNHHGQVALLNMGFPRVFILIRNYEDVYPCDFDTFCGKAEVNFLDSKDREEADKETILIDAWNFLALTEEEEDRLSEEEFE